jgi:hypothetical protein
MRSRDDLFPTYITGKVTLSDGSETEFSIQPDLGWQQWGNYTEKLGATSDLMEELANAAYEAGLRDADDDFEDEEDED